MFFVFFIPVIQFHKPYSTVVYAFDNSLLGAHIADDEQWRFPMMNAIPEKVQLSVLYFEDEYFYYHPGVNPFSLIRAAKQNIWAGEIVSGGSTITMQVARLSHPGKPRTFFQKMIEIILSIRMEFSKTKNEILRMYVTHAPFGGNVVGIEAVSWRYFGKDPSQLSWAESATLAVLPNAPGLVYPGKKRKELKKKRDFLINKLHYKGIIDSITCMLSKEEPLPESPKPLPRKAPHLLDYFITHKRGHQITTTVRPDLQEFTTDIINGYIKKLKHNQIHDAAALILELKTGDVLAYVGNANFDENHHGEAVDIIRSRRSPGSLLKPFLYAAMLNEGKLLPDMLVDDIPIQLGNYTPKNFEGNYKGAVSASEALSHSLNVPAVMMLKDYGIPKFYHLLKNMGMTTLQREATHYGTSIILGGAEVTLWDICGMYASIGRNLLYYRISGQLYSDKTLHPPNCFADKSYVFRKEDFSLKKGNLSAGSVWFTIKAMQQVNRPNSQIGWEYFTNTKNIAWKTGTSFGFRDAWAVGMNADYVVGVWVGNADGEGRPGLIGTLVAGPILFHIFRTLKYSGNRFEVPVGDLVYRDVCTLSGYLASNICNVITKKQIPESGRRSYPCSYHRWIHLDEKEIYRVNAKCEPLQKMIKKTWFVLPPVQEWFYKKFNSSYRTLPPLRRNCEEDAISMIDLIYPKKNAQIYIPTNLDGTGSKVSFEAVHRYKGKKLYWHLDDQYLGYTKYFHQMEINGIAGPHILTLIDEDGERLVKKFTLLEKKK